MNEYGYLLPLLTGLIGVASTGEDIRSRNRATLQQMRYDRDAYMVEAKMTKMQYEELDRQLGDKMSETALRALKAEAALRAGAAETGTTGGTTKTAVKNAIMQASLDNAEIINQGRMARVDVARTEIMKRIDFENRMKGYVSGMQSPLSAGLSTFSAGMQGMYYGMGYLGTEGREKFTGVQTEGAKTNG